MPNITHEVWRIIDYDPSIKLDLARGLLNVRALARHLKSNLPSEATEDAIISAIRRYPLSKKSEKDMMDLAMALVKGARVSTRGDIVNFSLEKTKDSQSVLMKVISKINYAKGETLRMVQGEETISLMVDKRKYKELKRTIPRGMLIGEHETLSEISIRFHKEEKHTPGVVQIIIAELARNGINIYELMSCSPEIFVFVSEKDVVKAYECLHSMIKKS
jgi:aspartokinase